MNSFYDKFMFIIHKYIIIFIYKYLYLKIFLLKCNNKSLSKVAPKSKEAPTHGKI